jgi:hypothetical protein
VQQLDGVETQQQHVNTQKQDVGVLRYYAQTGEKRVSQCSIHMNNLGSSVPVAGLPPLTWSDMRQAPNELPQPLRVMSISDKLLRWNTIGTCC